MSGLKDHTFGNLPEKFNHRFYSIMKIFRKTKRDGVSQNGPKPVHRKSKFTEHLSEHGPEPVYRKSKFTENFDISMTDEDIQAMYTTAPCQSAHLGNSKQVEVHPTNNADLALVVSPSTPPPRPAAQASDPSPMSVYSRASVDSKPFVPIGESRESTLRQADLLSIQRATLA